LIRHIVALRYKPEVSADRKAGMMSDLAALSDHLQGVLDFRSFSNVSPEEPLVRGFLDVFWFDFQDAAARDAYLVDEAHRTVGGQIGAACQGGAEGVLVLDVAL